MNENKNKRFYKNHETSQLSFKRSQFVILMCICLFAIVAFTMVNIESTSADTIERMLYKTSENLFDPLNITEIQYCDNCHADEMPDTWVSVTVDSETTSEITYYVSGSDIFDGEEGWGVFDPLENNIAHGFNSGYFTLSKDGRTYRVFWVDNGTGGTGEAGGGSAYKDITTPNNPPSDPIIDGPTSGNVSESLIYSFVSTDEEEHNIFYTVKWGDGHEEDWFGPNPSGVKVTKSHTWSEPGTYKIEAKARDTNQAESNWNSFIVEISSQPQEPKLKIRLKMINIGRVCATVENVGTGNLSDISWNISVKGGIFRLIKRINSKGNDTIDTLAVGEKKVVCTPEKSIILKFGIAKVTVTATVGEQTFTHRQYVLVIGRLIFARPLLLRR
jgi:hypothetical protein